MITLRPSIVALLLIAANASADCWYDFQPAGAVNGRGILADVVSRSSKPAYFRQKYAHDLATQCHEATHLANSCVCSAAGYEGFYVGDGKCCILPEPRLTLLGVAQFVPARDRGPLYHFYLVQQPTSQPIINSLPLYVLDEWSASINGWQAAIENGVPDTGDAAMAKEFCRYADALIVAVQQRDPQYSRLKELSYFVEWQKGRVVALSKAPGKSVFVGGFRGTEPMPQRYAYSGACFGGTCQGGVCYGNQCQQMNCGPAAYPQSYQPPRPPAVRPQAATPIPAPPPTAVPSTPMKGCECVEKWASFNAWKGEVNTQLNSQSSTITNINQRITAIENTEKPKVPTADEVADIVLQKLDHPTPIRVYAPNGKLLGESTTNIFRKDGSIDFTFNPRALLDSTAGER